MPRLSSRLLAAMLAESGEEQVLVPVLGDIGASSAARYEALHAIYHRSCLPAIENRILANDLRATSFHSQVSVRELDEVWLRWYDPSLDSITNINTPEELAALARIVVADRNTDPMEGWA
jgi:molybdopterin-guanine dinucleotide biosynthesis protein A